MVARPSGVTPSTRSPPSTQRKCASQRCRRGLNNGCTSPVSVSLASVCAPADASRAATALIHAVGAASRRRGGGVEGSARPDSSPASMGASPSC